MFDKMQCLNCRSQRLKRCMTKRSERRPFGNSQGIINYILCQNCKLVFQESVPSVQQLIQYYSTPRNWEEWKKKELSAMSSHLQICRFYLNIIDRTVKLPEKGTVFDYACGYGGFLHLMDKRG